MAFKLRQGCRVRKIRWWRSRNQRI